MMDIFDLLKGKKVIYKTDAKIDVELIIQTVTEVSTRIQVTEDTRENDYYGTSYDRISYKVKFTNGFEKNYDSLREIKFP